MEKTNKILSGEKIKACFKDVLNISDDLIITFREEVDRDRQEKVEDIVKRVMISPRLDLKMNWEKKGLVIRDIERVIKKGREKLDGESKEELFRFFEEINEAVKIDKIKVKVTVSDEWIKEWINSGGKTYGEAKIKLGYKESPLKESIQEFLRKWSLEKEIIAPEIGEERIIEIRKQKGELGKEDWMNIIKKLGKKTPIKEITIGIFINFEELKTNFS